MHGIRAGDGNFSKKGIRGVLDSAKEFISQDEAKFEDVITDLEISKKSVKIEQERAEEYRREAEALKKEVERQKEKTKQQKEKILEKAREEAKQIYVKAKEEADSIIKEMNKQAKEANNKNKALEQRQKLNEKLSTMQADFLKSKRVKPNHKAPENLKVGDRVYVISFDQNGEVLAAPDKNKEVMVQMGIMKMKVPMAELMLDDTPQPKEKQQKKQQPARAKLSKSSFISAEIDCRGQLVDEAIANIDKYKENITIKFDNNHMEIIGNPNKIDMGKKELSKYVDFAKRNINLINLAVTEDLGDIHKAFKKDADLYYKGKEYERKSNGDLVIFDYDKNEFIKRTTEILIKLLNK